MENMDTMDKVDVVDTVDESGSLNVHCVHIVHIVHCVHTVHCVPILYQRIFMSLDLVIVPERVKGPDQLVFEELISEPQLPPQVEEDPSCCQSVIHRTKCIFSGCSYGISTVWKGSGCSTACTAINDFYFKYTSMEFRNTIRILITWGLPTLGGGVSGDSSIRKILRLSPRSILWVGAAIGGLGNALSNILEIESRFSRLLKMMVAEWNSYRNKITPAFRYLHDKIVAVEQQLLKIQEFREFVISKTSEWTTYKNESAEEIKALKEQVSTLQAQMAELQKNSAELLRRLESNEKKAKSD